MSGLAGLVVDMLNAYRHRDADVLARSVATIVDPLADIVSRAKHDDGAISFMSTTTMGTSPPGEPIWCARRSTACAPTWWNRSCPTTIAYC